MSGDQERDNTRVSEFDRDSAERMGRIESRLDSIDAMGTRGLAVLAVQVQEIAKDMAKHEVKHDADTAARATARRWIIGAAIAAIAAIDGPLVTVILNHGH